MNRLGHSLRELGPYALIALTVPGGTLIALALWALERRAPRMMAPVRRALSPRRPHHP